MTMRFAVNKVCPTSPANEGANILWEFFSFMTSASPNGPGWTSVGESDGVTGGIGTTGIITSASDLVLADAWFVLESPDNARQILFERDVGGSTTSDEAGFYYNRSADYTGGSSSTLPTSTAGNSRTVWKGSSVLDTGVYHFIADDTTPYFWAFFGFNGSTPEGAFAFVPVTTPYPGDVDPYVLIACNSGFVGTALSAVPTIDTSPGCRAWNNDASAWGGCGFSYFYASGAVYSGTAPFGPGSKVVAMPSLFATRAVDSPAFVKGYQDYLRWKTSDVPAKMTLESQQYVVASDILLVWDGITDII